MEMHKHARKSSNNEKICLQGGVFRFFAIVTLALHLLSVYVEIHI